MRMNIGMGKWPKVSVIILNWNGWQDTLECLESLQQLTYPNYQIIVVDNGSTDDSVEKIVEWCKGKIFVNTKTISTSPDLKPIEYVMYNIDTAVNGGEVHKEAIIERLSPNRKLVLIKTCENLGFTGGNNIAIKYSLKNDYSYMWLLNNDTIVDSDALSKMVKFAENSVKTGMVGSKILSYERPDTVQMIGSNKTIWPLHKKNNKDISLAKEHIQVKWLGGASLLVKKAIIEHIGMLDEKYFLYYEEKDWCIRAGHRGWKLYCILDSKVWHKGGASTGSERVERIFFGKKIARLTWESFLVPTYYESRNGPYFTKKNYPLYFIPYSIFRTLHLIVQVILYDNYKVSRIMTILRGAWDGVIGKMGKTIDPLKKKYQ